MVQRKQRIFLCSTLFLSWTSFPLSEVAKAQSASDHVVLNSHSGPFEAAAALLAKHAKQGAVNDQYQLASLYRIGRGVPQDDGLAFTWMHEAAKNGHARAQYSIATMYLAGRGTAVDASQAEYWAKLAVANGHQNAIALIARMTANPQNASERTSLGRTVPAVNAGLLVAETGSGAN